MGLFLCPYCRPLQRRYGGCLPCDLALVEKSRCLTTGRASAFSVSVPDGFRQCQTSSIMQQVIEFDSSAKGQLPIDVRATIQRKLKSLNLWLNSKSEFYSRICEFSVTRRLVIRVNLVSLCVIVAAVAIEQQPITSVVSTLCAGWIVYRINKTDKRGGAE